MRSLLSVALGSFVTGLATAGLQCLSARRSADAIMEVRCRKPGRSVLARGFADALAIDAASLPPPAGRIGILAAGVIVHDLPVIGRAWADLRPLIVGAHLRGRADPRIAGLEVAEPWAADTRHRADP
jgi:hypothetical protein